MAYNYPLRAYGDRGRGAVHAPHADDAFRPLCRKTPLDWRGPHYRWDIENHPVTCRRCQKLMGHAAPAPKRLGERAAVGKALVELGLRRNWDFRIRTTYMPKSETGGHQIVAHTSVLFIGRDVEEKVLKAAPQLIEKLWSNDYGRNHWTIWQTHTRKDGTRWVEMTTEWYSDHLVQTFGYTQVASWRDQPDSDLWWGQTPKTEV